MKRIFQKLMATACATLAGFLALQAQEKNNFLLRGTLTGLPDSMRVSLVDAEQKKTVVLCDTVPADGAFVLEARVEHPTYCQLCFRRYNAKRGGYYNYASIYMMADGGNMAFNSRVTLDSLSRSYQPELLADIEGTTAQEEFDEEFRTLGCRPPESQTGRLQGSGEVLRVQRQSRHRQEILDTHSHRRR